MRFDAESPDRAAFAQVFDACVIGSGPAGLTLARRLAAAGQRVALMEAGGLDWSPESQDAYAGESTGHPYYPLDEARLRFFGGTSYHWNGLCRAFEPGDFAARPQNPLSGWPIGPADLDPFATEAAEILELAPIPRPDLPAPEQEAPYRLATYYRSPPVRFGEKYLAEITASERIALCLHANLVDLRLDAAHQRVTEARFRSYAADDPGFAVRARTYCLCTGGIENARLLLNFDSQVPGGLGNAHDQVGRCFSEHLDLVGGFGEVLIETRDLDTDAFFIAHEAFLAEAGILPAVLRITPRPRRRLALGTEIARTAQCGLPFGTQLARAVLGETARCDTGGLAEYWRSRDPEAHPWGVVTTNAEQHLNPESRVGLAETRDAFGLRRTRLHWAPQEADLEALRQHAQAFAGQLARSGTARMRLPGPLQAGTPVPTGPEAEALFRGAWHHMCTTRMSDDPRHGVVDRDCRVHGLENLHLGGSSVFASGSFVNPTYTIVQLALRLGAHLGEATHSGLDLPVAAEDVGPEDVSR